MSQNRKTTGRGLSAAQRAMWDRLYSRHPGGSLPWSIHGPYGPLMQAVKDGWLRPPGPLLDVGCGVGTNAYWLASQGFRVTGVDVAEGAIEAAVSAGKTPKQNPTFQVDDILVSTLPRAKFRSAIDVGCFQTLPPGRRRDFARSAARLLAPGAPYLLFWVGREERGAWGPPHRLSVRDVVEPFEPWFLVDRIVHRPRRERLTLQAKRSSRPLATLAGYTALLARRSIAQPPPK